jgi:RND family efflux transporter MFP subunit
MRTRHLALLLAALTALAACGGAERAALPAAPPADAAALGVKVVRPQADAGAVLRATGEVRARHEAVLSAEASGRIARFAVDVGATVKKGQVLMELDASGPRIQLQQARASLAVADAAHRTAVASLRRVEELSRGQAASAAALEAAQLGEQQAAAALQQAEALVAGAEDQLAKNATRAPFDGVVTARLKSEGEYVALMPPTAVLALVDLSTVEVRAAVPETVVDLLTPGAELDGLVSPSQKPFRARVRTVGASVDAAGRTVDVRADPVGPPLKALRPGALVELRLRAASGGEAGLFLPAGTVQVAEGKSYVWTVVGGAAARRPVEVDRLSPGLVRVRAGLGAGDAVVATGGATLTDGVKVRVVE